MTLKYYRSTPVSFTCIADNNAYLYFDFRDLNQEDQTSKEFMTLFDAMEIRANYPKYAIISSSELSNLNSWAAKDVLARQLMQQTSNEDGSINIKNYSDVKNFQKDFYNWISSLLHDPNDLFFPWVYSIDEWPFIKKILGGKDEVSALGIFDEPMSIKTLAYIHDQRFDDITDVISFKQTSNLKAKYKALKGD